MRLAVGIPAYNEEQNIEALLKAITNQKLRDGVSLTQMLVVSDGSTDATPMIVSDWTKRDSRVELQRLARRSGKPHAINEIFKLADGDIIVLLDADTMPVGHNFLQDLTNPFRHNSNVGLVAAVGLPLPPQTLIGRAAVFSSNIRRRLLSVRPYFAFNVGLAISAKTAATLRLPLSIIGDDAYLYLKVKTQGKEAVVSRNARILYREPQSLEDFIMQRRRYDLNLVQLRQLFGRSIDKHINAGSSLLTAFFREMLRDTLGGLLWLTLRVFLWLKRSKETLRRTESPAKSTKGSLTLPRNKENTELRMSSDS